MLAALRVDNPIQYRDLLIEATPQVLQPYITASGELSAVWYEDLRRDAVRGTYAAAVIDTVDDGRFASLVRYSLSPLFGESNSTVLDLFAGGAQRLIEGAGRETIEHNAFNDRVRVGYARVPQAGCCAFCAMLASRGAVYRSSASAGGVVGRGVEEIETASKRGGQGRGVKVRGIQNLGDRYHDFCRCAVVPRFSDQSDPYLDEIQSKYQDQYRQVVQTEQSEYSKRNPDAPDIQSVSAKQTLAAWRQEFGTR